MDEKEAEARPLMGTIFLVVILSSTLAAGIVQDSLLEKLEKASAGGEVETTGCYFCHQDRKFFPFPSN